MKIKILVLKEMILDLGPESKIRTLSIRINHLTSAFVDKILKSQMIRIILMIHSTSGTMTITVMDKAEILINNLYKTINIIQITQNYPSTQMKQMVKISFNEEAVKSIIWKIMMACKTVSIHKTII